ncbi:MAG: HEAT repeat domain-containing protein [Candidatus Hodarchaeales archaeon]
MEKSELKSYINLLKSTTVEERNKAIDYLTTQARNYPEIVLKEIHKLIKKNDPAAHEIVRKLQSESSIPLLLKKLTEKDPGIQKQAYKTLCSYEKPLSSLIIGLRKLLSHESLKVQRAAISIISHYSIEEPLDDLIELLREDRENYSILINDIYIALGSIGSLKSVPVLLEGSQNEKRDDTLEKIVTKYGEEKVAVFQAKTKEKLDEIPEELLKEQDLLETLLEGFSSPDDSVRFNSIYLFCRITGEEQYELVFSKLGDTSADIRTVILTWLSRFKREETEKALIDSLGDSEVRSTASQLLEDNHLSDALVTWGLNSENPVIRGNSAPILARIGDVTTVPSIIRALYTDQVDENKIAFSRALGDLDDNAAVISLMDFTFSNNKAIIEEAEKSLAKIGESQGLTDFFNVINSLSRAKKPGEIEKIKNKVLDIDKVPVNLLNSFIVESQTGELRAAAASIAGWREMSECLDKLIVATRDENSDVRSKACAALAFAGEKAIEILIDSLADDSPIVRKEALESLVDIDKPLKYVHRLSDPERMIKIGLASSFKQLKPQSTIESLRKAIATESKRENIDSEVLNGFILAIGSPGDSSVIEEVLPFLESQFGATRVTALEALRQIADESTIIPVLRMLDDELETVHEKALQTLKTIGDKREELGAVIGSIVKLRSGEVDQSTADILVTQSSISLPLLHQVIVKSSKNAYLRKNAVLILGQIREQESEELLITLLEDDDVQVRVAAADSCGLIVSEKAVPALIDRLIDLQIPAGGQEIWNAVTKALASIGNISLLIEALGDKEDTSILVGIIRALRLIKDSRAVPALLKKLDHSLIEVKEAIIGALSDLRHPEAVQPLISSLTETSGKVRETACLALGFQQDPSAIYPLLETMDDDSLSVKSSAVEALGLIGETSGSPLKQLIKYLIVIRSGEVKEKSALAWMQDQDSGSIDQWLQEASYSESGNLRKIMALAIGMRSSEGGLAPLLRLLNDPDDNVRTAAAEGLGRFGSKEATSHLIEALSDGEMVNELAVGSLIMLGHSSLLINALDDERVVVRSGLCRILGQLQTIEATEPLIRLLNDPEIEVRTFAAESLGLINNKESLPHLEEKIKSDIEPRVRIACAASLGQIRDRRSFFPLFETEEDSDPGVKDASRRALDQVAGENNFTDVVKNLRGLRDNNKEARNSLVTLDVEKSSFLIEGLSSKNPRVREGCSFALGQKKQEHARLSLEDLVIDEDDDVRITSIGSLEIINNPESAMVIVKCLGDRETRVKGDEIWNVTIRALTSLKKVEPLVENAKHSIDSIRLGVIRVLGNLRVEVDVIVTALEDGNSETRKAACWALGEIGDRDKVPSLIKMLIDPEEDVRVETAISLGKIGDTRGIFYLLETTEDSSSDVVAAAEKSVKEIGEVASLLPVVEGLIAIRKKDTEKMGLDKLLGKQEALPYLIQIVSSVNSTTRRNSAICLATLGSEESLLPLTNLTTDPVEEVRDEAVKAIGKLAQTLPIPRETISRLMNRLTDSERIWRTTIETLVEVGQDEPLHEWVNNQQVAVRLGLAEILGRIGNNQSVPQVITLLSDQEEKIRVQAAIASGLLGDKRSVESLISHLATDTSVEVRINSAKALGEIKDIEATFALLEGEEQNKKDVTTTSSEALDLLGVNQKEKELVKVLRSLKESEESVRNSAITQIITIKEALRFLRKFLSSTNPYLRASSVLALGKVNDERSASKIRELLSDKETGVRGASAEALGLLTDLEAITLLISRIKDKNENMEVREISRDALVRIGSPTANELAECLASDGNKTVRLYCAQVFEQIADQKSISPLLDYGLRDKDEKVRETAVRALIRIGEPVVENISSVQDDKYRHARMAAAEVLGAIGSSMAMRKLEVALNDRDEQVRETAAKALQNLGLQAVISLCRCLASPSKETSRLAALVLLELSPEMRNKGDKQAVRFLKSVFKKRDKEIQATACQALGILGDKSAVEDVIHMLGSKHEKVRLAAVKALGMLQDGKSVPPLEQMLNDKSVEVRIAATEALESLEKKGVEAQIVEGLTDVVQGSKLKSLIRQVSSKELSKQLPGSLNSLTADLETKGLESVIARGSEIATGIVEQTPAASYKSQIDKLDKTVEKLKQLVKLHAQSILKDAELEQGQRSAVMDITKIINGLPYSEISAEEVGKILEQLAALNSINLLSDDDFNPLRSLLVSKLIG